jgi:small-conductance mechanosensitive channel
LESTINTVLLLAVLFTVLSELPVLDNLSTSLMAGSTVLIAAIGFAAQEPMANVISGMFLSFFKPFAAGDRVKLHSIGIIGWIEDIGLRHTVIRTVENNRLLVPNSVISRDVVENSNLKDEKILNFLDVKITYESDFDKAMAIMREEVTNHPGFLDTRSDEQKARNEGVANVMVRDIANNCAELRVGVWTANVDMSFQVCSDLRAQVLRRFKEEGLQLYYQTIRIEKGNGDELKSLNNAGIQ